jgi:acetyl esterase/lipase
MRLHAALVAFSSLVLGAPAPTIDVYMIGDSTMADKPNPDTNPERGWGQLLPQFFDGQVAVHNFAVNGRSTKSFIDEGKWAAVLGKLKNGDYVFVQFAHNDEKSEDTTRYTDPRTTFRRNLERFIGDTRAKGATPVLFTPIVRRKFNVRGSLEDTHGAYSPAIRDVAMAHDVPIIDLQSLTETLVRTAGPEGSKQLYVWVAPGESKMYPEGRQDDTHLSVLGATSVARLAVSALQQTSLPLGRHVRGVGDKSEQQTEMPLWPGAAPGALGDVQEDRPSITPFLGTTNATRAAIIIFPGGGYEHLATDKEGTQVARWLNTLGVTSFVARYRLGPRYHHPVMMQDALRAVRFVRSNAARWNLDPTRVGVLGFSAGGHMASTAGTHFDAGNRSSQDTVERVSSRPDVMVLVYPVITMDERLAHHGSRKNLLGDSPPDSLVRLMSNETRVTRETPPTFIVATTDDATVPVQNSLMFYEALRAAGVPAELHIFESGHHGFGLAPDDPVLSTWTSQCELWLRRHGWVR